MIEQLKGKLKLLNNRNFDAIALEVFAFQYSNNLIYKEYCKLLEKSPKNVNSVIEIPFLPIEFFKSHPIQSGTWQPQTAFMSSGTGKMQRSMHLVESLPDYLRHTVTLFEDVYGDLDQYMIAALLPSYQEQGNSSLIAMVDHFISRTIKNNSGYFLDDGKKLKRVLKKALSEGQPTILLGVTYALLDLAEMGEIDFNGIIIMETGGMKGRREELIRADLHQRLCQAFHVESIHSEYGMTELFSQAYSTGSGSFRPARTMRILVRDLNDPFSYVGNNKSGGINVVDLANLHSVAFIETKDIGSVNQEGNFTVLGRYDNSDIRGCNLLL